MENMFWNIDPTLLASAKNDGLNIYSRVEFTIKIYICRKNILALKNEGTMGNNIFYRP